MKKRLWMVGAALGTLTLAVGQDTSNRLTVPFRDASKPRTVNVDVFNGSITVRGYSGNDAIVETTGRGPRHERSSANVPSGMHRVGEGGGGLDITEDNNVISI